MNINEYALTINFPVDYKRYNQTYDLWNLFSEIPKSKSKSICNEHPLIMLATIAGLNSLNIILADDDPDDREIFREAIEKVNSKIIFQSVEDGIQLMKILQDRNTALPDIVFLDLNMPGKTGKECLREIRSDKKLSTLPVIIYSTSSHEKDINETHSFGANLYIRKPNSFSELINITKRVFELDWDEQKPHSHKKNYFLSSGLI